MAGTEEVGQVKPAPTILGLPRKTFLLVVAAVVAVAVIGGGLWYWSGVRQEREERLEKEKKQAVEQEKKRLVLAEKRESLRIKEQAALAERQAQAAREAKERERNARQLRSKEIAEREAAAALPPEVAAEMEAAVRRKQAAEAARRQKATEGGHVNEAMRQWLPRYHDRILPVVNAATAVRDRGTTDPSLCTTLRRAVAGVRLVSSQDPQVNADVAEALRLFDQSGASCEKGLKEATSQRLQRANERLAAVEQRLSGYQ